MEEQWYETWFDSPYYHILYAHRDDEEAKNFIYRLAQELNISSGAKILDAACGKGRHARTLASLGYDVTGIDLSESNIEAAKEFEASNLLFEEWDIRQVYRENYFDCVFNLFSSFGYFDNDADDLQVISSFAKNLKQGGILALDYINSEYAVKEMKKREIIQRGDVQFHIKKKIEKGFIKKSIEFLSDEGDQHFEECLKIINLRQFENMLQQSGFVLRQIFGDYELNGFNSSSSPRLIMVAQKL